MTTETAHLGLMKKGFKGLISGFKEALSPEIEDGIDRLRDMGFAEGLTVEILHQNPFGADPIAVQIDSMTVALRRREAALVLVTTHD